MEDTELYKELNDYDQTNKNKYEENWGTLLNFLDESNLDEVTMSKLSKMEDEETQSLYLQNHDLIDELKDHKRPKNMADMYDALTNVPNKTSVSIQPDGKTPEAPNYVYQSQK